MDHCTVHLKAFFIAQIKCIYMQMKHKLDAILFLMVSFYVFEIQNYTHIWMHVLHTKVLEKLPKKCWILAFFPTFIVRNALTEMIDEDEGPVLKKKIFFLRNPNVNSSSKNFLEKSNLNTTVFVPSEGTSLLPSFSSSCTVFFIDLFKGHKAI